MMTLLNHAVSTCSQKVRLCLHEKRLAFEERQVNLRARENLSPEYLRLNPNGVVPTLLDNGAPVVDSSVILEYLEESYPDVPLMPDTAIDRAGVRAWLRFFEEVPTAAVRFPSYNQAFVPANFSRQSEMEFQRDADSRPLRKEFYRQMGRQGFDEAAIRGSLEALKGTVKRMHGVLGDGRPWLSGTQLTLADICVLPLLDRTADLGLYWLWSDMPQVQRWYAHWRSRPSYAATYYPGSRLSEIYADLRDRAPTQAWFEQSAEPIPESTPVAS